MFIFYITGLGKSFKGTDTAEAIYEHYESAWPWAASTSILMVPPAIGVWE